MEPILTDWRQEVNRPDVKFCLLHRGDHLKFSLACVKVILYFRGFPLSFRVQSCAVVCMSSFEIERSLPNLN